MPVLYRGSAVPKGQMTGFTPGRSVYCAVRAQHTAAPARGHAANTHCNRIQIYQNKVHTKLLSEPIEVEVTFWSGTLQKLRPFLKFPFKPPDGIPLVQSCL